MLWTAFLLGLLGSMHCLGMCGPLVMAMPFRSGTDWKNRMSRIWYQMGRVFTYALFGAVIGLVGEMVAFAGWQQGLSIFAGILMLLLALSIKMPRMFRPRLYNISSSTIKKGITYLLRQKPLGASFLVGLLNGFLPCGLIYVALAGAVGTGNALDGAIYMALFGLGTLPMMLSVTFISEWATPRLRLAINKAVPVIVIFIGLLLIVRGLNLGIPYLSPEISLHAGYDVSKCHQ